MIFVTVGTQLPFPRLLDAMERIARRTGEEVVAQTGLPARRWPALRCQPLMTPREFEARFTAARVVVAHVGIGTVLSARMWNRPLVLLPRRYDLGEHRNDHQIATARQLEGMAGVRIAWSAEDIEPLLARGDPRGAAAGAGSLSAPLIQRVQSFIDG
ncbi:glycosyltransferase [Limimaricola sp.]|uniref:glycosyltransferase n=1 Tax=Limimaricola sp. TaxID=2211665 RepID=UPI0040593136